MKVAFIGLGNMGSPMARNLLRAGHQVAVYNRTQQKAATLAADGARVAASVKDAVQDAEVVITMLADDRALADTVFSDDGILQALPSGAIHMGASTISVALSRRLAEAHASAGQGYVASPVLGRPEAAAVQKLWLMAAGPADQVERCRPLMDALGRGVTIAGDQPWQANLIKITANFTLASMLETLGEAFALIRQTGIEPAQFLEVISSLYQSPVYAAYGKIIVEEKYEPAGFRMKLGLKDVNLALEAAGDETVPLPLASLVRDHFLEGLAHGLGDKDWAALAFTAKARAGV